MCANPDAPDTDAFLRNLRAPIPTPRKIKLVLKNTGLKIVRLKSCCGHPGEPGC